jgi:hypothetical protein
MSHNSSGWDFHTDLSYSSGRSSRQVLDRIRHLLLVIPEGKRREFERLEVER